MRHGVIAGGNWIVDRIKVVDAWPVQDALASILRQSSGGGGSPCNILVNLARLGARYPLEGIGLVGDDADGRWLVEYCGAHGIDTTQLQVTPAAATSYTDVMTVESTGRRTFFHQRGANALLGPEHFDFTGSTAKLFHLGYLLLLDGLDCLVEGRPRACDVLQKARSAGLTTSVDCVSEDSQRFQTIVTPVLPCVDVFFANDFETERITGISLRAGGQIAAAQVVKAGRRLLELGVRAQVVIHFPEGVCALGRDGTENWQPSVRTSPAQIAGTAGAGDALAAGVLFGLHEERPMAECLRFGVAAAAASLRHASCSEGVMSLADCVALSVQRGFNPPPAKAG